MGLVSISLLALSVILSSGRNLLSKGISDIPFGKKSFFMLQSAIFFSGTLIIFAFNVKALAKVSILTLIYALIYGIVLVSAQWSYTAAQKNGSASICATVYSLGFIIPTLSGMIFWDQKITVFKIIGICTVIPVIILSGSTKTDNANKKKTNRFIFPLIIAMLSSGGLGVMQNLQQRSSYPEEYAAFILLSFAFAAVLSLICSFFCHREETRVAPKKIGSACGVGICFGSCNLLNTILAGRLDSAVFFPTLNIGIILLSLVLSMIIFKEKLTKTHVFIILLSFVSIIFINVLP